MRRTQTGFTLIELMIVVSIIGILSAVALVSYNEYISVSQVGIVRSNFDEAKRLVFNHYALNGQRVSLGINPSVPDDFNGWVALVNPDNLESPTSEGPAYIEGAANPLTGSVGLLASGSWATGDSQLVISQPAFGGLPAESITVRMQDL